MKIAHILWSMGTGGTENMVVDIASVQSENHEVCIFVINDWVEEYMLRKLNSKCKVVLLRRKPVEIKKMVDRLNAITLFIERPTVKEESFTNHADKNVRDYQYDYEVYNDGTLIDLKDSAALFFEFLSCL